jgi:hypothetical protein
MKLNLNGHFKSNRAHFALRASATAVLAALASAPSFAQLNSYQNQLDGGGGGSRIPGGIPTPDLNGVGQGAGPVTSLPASSAPSMPPNAGAPIGGGVPSGAGGALVAPPPPNLVTQPVPVVQPAAQPVAQPIAQPSVTTQPPAVSSPLPPTVAPAIVAQPTKPPVDVDLPKPVPQGAGVVDVSAPALPVAGPLPPAPSPGSGTVQGMVAAPSQATQGSGPNPTALSSLATPPTAQAGPAKAGGGLTEMIPSTQQLAATTQTRGPERSKNADTTPAIAPPTACIPVTFRPDPNRSHTSLVDLTGAGLIVSPVPNSHINTVFARAGYQAIEITQPVRWCVAQSTARELLSPPSSTANTLAGFLVQVGQAWRLMSQEQWQSYQASLQPAPVAATTTTAVSQPAPAANRSVRSVSSRPATARGSNNRVTARPVLPQLR